VSELVIFGRPKRLSVGTLRPAAIVVIAETKSITNNRSAAFQFKVITSFVNSSKATNIEMRIQKFIWKIRLESCSVIKLESELLDGVHQRLIREFLDFVILMELSKRPLASHDVIAIISDRHNILLSSGTVYTCLYTLERDGLVKGSLNSGKRVFTLTERGKETAREFSNAKTKILGLLLGLFVAE